MTRSTHKMTLTSLMLAAAMALSCAGKQSTSGGSGSGSGTIAGGGSTTNGLGNSYPAGLAIESPYASGNAVEGLLKVRAQTRLSNPIPETDISFQDFSTRSSEVAARLNGTSAASCQVQLGLFRKSLEAKCYGPSATYTLHPEGGSSGSLPSGDLGIWRETETYVGGASNPCVIAKYSTGITGKRSGSMAKLNPCIKARNHEFPHTHFIIDWHHETHC